MKSIKLVLILIRCIHSISSLTYQPNLHFTGSVHSAPSEARKRTIGSDIGKAPRSKWNESGFRPHLCTYRLNWARKTSWGWWNEWDDTVLQTQDSKFEPWRSEGEHATSRSQRLPTILSFTRGWRRNIFCFFQTADTGNRTPNSGVKGSGANHYTRAPAHHALTIAPCPSRHSCTPHL